uniref:RPA43 OB domain-containing protein n=1 Tax=Anopheles epiroticus TaxID=199890 RepID=A0A182P1E0_9DIPT
MHRTTIAKYTKFSAEELQKSIADPLSCVVLVQLNEILSLRPRDCEHIVKGVRRCVTDKIGRYHAKVNGIVLGYAKIRIDNALSALRLDSPYLHVRATIDYYVFQPRIGSTLRGTVNYVSKEFVSAVIYRVFNVTVKLGKNANRQHTIVKGSDISFTVRSCDMKSELPVIEGELVLNGVIPVNIKKEPGVENDDSVDCPPMEEQKQQNGVEEEMETEETNVSVVVKKEPKTSKQKKSEQKKKQKKPVVASPVSNGLLAGGEASSSSESEDDERSLLIKSLIDQMFGDEFKKSTKKSSKKSKKKDKKKSPKKSLDLSETPIRIKQEKLSTDEDEPTSSVQSKPSKSPGESKQNGTNGYRANGSGVAASSTPIVATTDGQTAGSSGKKRKIRFDLNHTTVRCFDNA